MLSFLHSLNFQLPYPFPICSEIVCSVLNRSAPFQEFIAESTPPTHRTNQCKLAGSPLITQLPLAMIEIAPLHVIDVPWCVYLTPLTVFDRVYYLPSDI